MCFPFTISFHHAWSILGFGRIILSPSEDTQLTPVFSTMFHNQHHEHDAVTRLELSALHQQSIQIVKQKHHGATSPRNHWKEQ